jgi:hypothetical protein
VTKLNVVHLSHQKDEGTWLQLEEVTLSRLLLEDLRWRAAGLLDSVTCEWMYEVRWGPKDPVYGLADRSAGHCLYRLAQWCTAPARLRRRAVARIPVSAAWVRKHMPDAGYPFDGSEPGSTRGEEDHD